MRFLQPLSAALLSSNIILFAGCPIYLTEYLLIMLEFSFATFTKSKKNSKKKTTITFKTDSHHFTCAHACIQHTIQKCATRSENTSCTMAKYSNQSTYSFLSYTYLDIRTAAHIFHLFSQHIASLEYQLLTRLRVRRVLHLRSDTQHR